MGHFVLFKNESIAAWVLFWPRYLFKKKVVNFWSWIAITSASIVGSQAIAGLVSGESTLGFSFSMESGSSIINFGIELPSHIVEFELPVDALPLTMKLWDSRGNGHFSFWSSLGSLASLLVRWAQWYPEFGAGGWLVVIWFWKKRWSTFGSAAFTASFLSSKSNIATGSMVPAKWVMKCLRPWKPFKAF